LEARLAYISTKFLVSLELIVSAIVEGARHPTAAIST